MGNKRPGLRKGAKTTRPCFSLQNSKCMKKNWCFAFSKLFTQSFHPQSFSVRKNLNTKSGKDNSDRPVSFCRLLKHNNLLCFICTHVKQDIDQQMHCRHTDEREAHQFNFTVTNLGLPYCCSCSSCSCVSFSTLWDQFRARNIA